ncbi:uncharacterized protein BT62DRAFT_244798 [Guyanagaster necrorhizus]|uniref:Uncharacterized protein n=1 Tax=Guyanagaster necrorhizus TaxID=856835 RepID=A0A9P7VR47_9AGAR|nr:uncharacterized protein BT62DRAFT_244798 [Guyanagaster necrorhizus MCA 3950]KAG7444461.1 hypothetical protein BT62DRAFT_244798 [Guyanagaster necrorhizus MCA 3950]
MQIAALTGILFWFPSPVYPGSSSSESPMPLCLDTPSLWTKARPLSKFKPLSGGVDYDSHRRVPDRVLKLSPIIQPAIGRSSRKPRSNGLLFLILGRIPDSTNGSKFPLLSLIAVGLSPTFRILESNFFCSPRRTQLSGTVSHVTTNGYFPKGGIALRTFGGTPGTLLFQTQFMQPTNNLSPLSVSQRKTLAPILPFFLLQRRSSIIRF